MKRFIPLILATGLLLSCSGRETFRPEPKLIAEFTATAERLAWENGDRILVNDGVKSRVYTALASGETVSFSSEGALLSEEKTYTAAYPAATSSFEGDSLKIALPSTYELSPGEYPQIPAVGICDGASRHFVFRNVCGLLGFDVAGDDVLKVSVTGIGGQPLSGLLYLPDASDPNPKILAGADSLVLSSKYYLEPGHYYLPMLSGDYPHGIRISIIKSDGSRIERDYPSFSLERSAYKDIEYIDSGRFIYYNIETPDQFLEFLSDASQCESYVTARLKADINLGGVEAQGASSWKGTFDGAGHALLNWHSQSPLFDSISTGGCVKNLTVGSSCMMIPGGRDSLAFIANLNEGTISNCVNEAPLEAGIIEDKCIVAPFAAVSRGNVYSCTNHGMLSLTADQASDIRLGGIVGENGKSNLSGCGNKAAIKVSGTMSGKAYIGGIVGHSGESTSSSEFVLSSCTNSGTLSVALSGNEFHVAGIAGWTSIPVSGNARNTGRLEITVGDAATANVGGIIGSSLSEYSTIYNEGEIVIDLADNIGCIRVGGVAGNMAGSSLPYNVGGHLVTGQNSGTISVRGGESSDKENYIGGVVGYCGVKNVSQSNTSWATCNTNHGDITVSCPLRVIVGGVIARETGTSMAAGSATLTSCKNDGNIEVNSPAANSYIGGVVGWHGRGRLGNANAFGQAAKTAGIRVTGAGADVYVGGYAGWISTDNGNNYPSCCAYISGCGLYGSIDALGATAAVIAGGVNTTGASTTNGIMLGSSASERPKISRAFVLNGTVIDDVASSFFNVNTFFGEINPSTITGRTKTDGTSLKGIWYFCVSGGSAESDYTAGLVSI